MRPPDGLDFDALSQWVRSVPAVRLLVTKKDDPRLVNALLWAWGVAIVALTVVLFVMRVVNGPLHHSAWVTAWVFVLGAPILLMLLNLVLGWLWFGLFLLTYPFPPLRRSRFMKLIDPSRSEEPPE